MTKSIEGKRRRVRAREHFVINGHLVKECIRCEQLVPIVEYWQNEHTWDGLVSTCRVCSRLDQRRNRKLKQAQKEVQSKRIGSAVLKPTNTGTEGGLLEWIKDLETM